MFSNTKASPSMLLILVFLLFTVIILSVLVAVSFSNSAPVGLNNQQNSGDQSATPENNSGNNQKPQNPQDKFSKALSAIPESGFPANKCPQALIEGSSGQRFALDNNRKYSISADIKIWIKANCADTQILNF